MIRILLLALGFFVSCPAFADQPSAPSLLADQKIVRAAVIGGMSMTTELWAEISKMFEADTGRF